MAAAITEVLKEEPLVERILHFVSDVPDFHSCAISCRRFSKILQKDTIWKYCPGKFDTSLVGETNRDKARRHYEHRRHCAAIKEIRKHQAGEHFKKDKDDNERLYLEKTTSY